MLTRICLIVAIVAGLAVGGINIVKVKEIITGLRTNLAEQTSQKEEAQTQLASTKKTLDKTQKELEVAKNDIVTANDERDKAVANAENQTKRATKLTEDLAKAAQERNDIESELSAWKNLGIAVDQIKKMVADDAGLKTDNAKLNETIKNQGLKITGLNNRLQRYEDPDNYKVELPVTLKGKVLVADPKWDFVVLNVGQNQGALEDGVMLVNRNGRLVAKVQIRSVQPDRCIANVLPNWKLGDVMEGDQVIP